LAWHIAKKAEVEAFNHQLEESLDDANFMIDGEGKFDSTYLDDVDDDVKEYFMPMKNMTQCQVPRIMGTCMPMRGLKTMIKRP
jgi:glycerate kinase